MNINQNLNPIKNSIYKYNIFKQKLSFVRKKNKLIIIDGIINYPIDKINLSSDFLLLYIS